MWCLSPGLHMCPSGPATSHSLHRMIPRRCGGVMYEDFAENPNENGVEENGVAE